MTCGIFYKKGREKELHISTHTRVVMNYGSLSKPFRGHRSYVTPQRLLVCRRYLESINVGCWIKVFNLLK
ncbi:hypothetical protein Bccel_0768 [Pseudobacteroides cellulosolvens ATCC 35603 = DSM 2933]|uniref:Uncharacterized protein n=1 Tax=Pseudobacteroides cellulosolvens ATCC 35603 = DSM 2933 TaxID=398512 RepID=A0A0L6JII4_9FIRM|nr:hypothetical protein Bccel_0768 [Pseudobacteroides cellulosolvens ATCC 35603 = DSM 2933]